MKSKDKPFILYVAEKIYLEISKIKKNNKNFSNENAIDNFIGSKVYKNVSSGKFHDNWFEEMTKKNEKIPEETMRLLKLQKEMMIKQLILYPELYYTKNHFPLKISKRAFDHLWRICESYELWCKETNQSELIILGLID